MYFDKSNFQIYVIGGVVPNTNEAVKTCMKFDLNSNEWIDLPDMMEARH